MAVVVSLLLALTMVPAAGIQPAFADEPAERPATTGGDVPLEGTGLGAEDEADGPVTATVREDGSLVAEGLIYKSEGNGAVLAGFEGGASLDREIAVPEKLTDGVFEYTVKGVGIAEGQSAPNVLSLELPQTIENVNTKSLAAAMPALARVSVDGRGGAYSSANGMLFKQESITASSDGSTTRIANRELVWAPPAMVIARVPGTCKAVAPGAFTDDRALETVMVFSIVDSVAKAEKGDKGNVTKEGAFTDEQVSRVNIVTPMETLVYPEGDRIGTDAFLSQDEPLNEKHIPWCDCGFSMERFTVGIPYGSTSLAVAVPEDGRVGTPEITIGHYTDHPEWDPKGDTGEPQSGLVFEYKADMTVSVSWKGSKDAIPSHLELPAYVVENGVKTAVTEVAPSAFEGTSQLESIVVPEGVTSIGESAFAGCSNLKDATLPLTLKTMDDAAFGDRELDGYVFSEGFQADEAVVETRPDSIGIPVANDDGIERGSVVTEGDAVQSRFLSADAVMPAGVSRDNADRSSDSLAAYSYNDYYAVYDYVVTILLPKELQFSGAPSYSNSYITQVDLAESNEAMRVCGILVGWPHTRTYALGVSNEDYATFVSGNTIGLQLLRGDGSCFHGLQQVVTGKPGYRLGGYTLTGSTTPILPDYGASSSFHGPQPGFAEGTAITVTAFADKDTTYNIESEIGKSITTSGKQLNSKFQSYYTKSQVDGGGSNVNVNTSNLNAQAAKLVSGSATSLKSALDGAYAGKSAFDTLNSTVGTINSSYLSKSAASGTYLTKTDAGKTYATQTALSGKADKSLLSKSGEAAFTATSTVRGAINSVSSVANGAKSTADANKTSIGGLGTRVTNIENGYMKAADADKKYQPAGDYAAKNHNHDGAYAKLGDFNALKGAVGDANSGLVKTVNGHTASINGINTSLGTKADKSYVGNSAADTNANTVAGKANSALSKANANATSITGVAGDLATAKAALEGSIKGVSDNLSSNYYTKENVYTKKEVDDKLGDLGGESAKALLDEKADKKATEDALAKKLDRADVNKYDTNKKLDDAFAAAETKAADDLAEAKTELEGEIGGVDDKADANAEAISALDAATVKASEFGSIEYAGLEEGGADVYPTTYRAGGTPSLHEPSKEGYAFKGWKWSRANASDGDTVAGGADRLAEAFSQAGAVTLTAEWEEVVPEANHFFTGERPLRANDGSDYQTSVIKVRLTDLPGWSLDKVEFSGDDATGLLGEGASVELRVGDTPDVMSEGKGTPLRLTVNGGAPAATPRGWSLGLAELGPDSYGVYVGVRVKTSDVVESAVESFTDGSYVASLVKMRYRFA